MIPRAYSHRLASGLFLALMAGAIVTTAVFPACPPLHRAAIWGLVLLVSFAGWGSAVARLAFPDRRADLGLRLAWGMGALVAIGGFACLVSVATREVLFVLVLAGVAFEYRELRGRLGDAAARAPGRGRPAAAAVAFVVLTVLVGIQYYAGAAGARVHGGDDLPAYLVYPEKILATGSLIEPFSVRRMSAYGGQSLLQALTLIGSGSAVQVALLDMGICLAVVLALVVGERERAPAGLWLLPVLLVVTLPNIRHNSGSLMSGVVFFLALFRTASWSELDTSPRRGAAVLGMLAAAAAALRQSCIVPAVAFVVLLYAPVALRAARLPRAERWRRLAEAAIAPAALLVFLLPWAGLSYRSSGTLLFPLFLGNYRPEYGELTAANPSVSRAQFLWNNITYCYPVRSLPLFFLAAMLIPSHKTRGALVALAAAALLGFVAIVLGFPLSESFAMSRYYFGFMVATVLAVSMYACSLRWADWRRDPFRTAAPALLVMAAIAYQIHGVAIMSHKNYQELANRLGAVAQQPSLLAPEDDRYRALQASVPAGAPLLVMLDQPFRLDFARNPITLIDLPGRASPPPGMPLDEDEALVEYLARQGFHHLAFVRSTESEDLYKRSKWKLMKALPIWSKAAPAILKVFDRFESLITSRQRLYDDGEMVVLDLAKRIDGSG